ncbi:hypothetical protein SSYRP_v1c04530 [Spiroplasma syrphidicola EA-1]|uniref:Uncharacterized protein n=1 Tax=Spiroplasma syrphidicola EA-1 TaxID=1276229 RepID=R4UIQ4_9MOLU|nr:hypothetical protein [Spiroplasma syrphidicola]AGM26045.1 hypothetical protein SSYRP_v1c04530 [Spiroplasma syrphidicola EA-1]
MAIKWKSKSPEGNRFHNTDGTFAKKPTNNDVVKPIINHDIPPKNKK